jgi:cytochrome bd-type quinol oxidase subunit 2
MLQYAFETNRLVTLLINSASWICIGLSTWILVHFLQEKTKKDIVKDTNTKTAYWCALMAVSIVLIASCAQYHKNNNCGQAYFKDTDQCTRNSYGMFLGASGVIIGIVMAILTAKSTLKVMYEMIVASVSLILFTFGVGFMTFGSGPATTIGNQYFSIWLAFICCISLLFESIREYIAECNKEEGATKEATETGTATKLDEEKPEGPTEAIEVDL